MHFMIQYTIAPENRNAAQTRFKETGGLPPKGATMIKRWHSAQGGRGFLIAESADGVAIARWTQAWSDLLEFEVTPIIDDEQMMSVLS